MELPLTIGDWLEIDPEYSRDDSYYCGAFLDTPQGKFVVCRWVSTGEFPYSVPIEKVSHRQAHTMYGIGNYLGKAVFTKSGFGKVLATKVSFSASEHGCKAKDHWVCPLLFLSTGEYACIHSDLVDL